AGLVEAFARQGSHVVFLDLDRSAGEALAAQLGSARFLACDLRDTEALTACAAEAIAMLGGADVLLNNAASDDRHGYAEITPEYWDERIATNLRHLFFMAQAVVPAMRAAGGGAIVNFGSISWHLGLRDLVIYQTAKAGIEGLTRSLARELGRDNIRVTTIVPGNVQTPRQAKWYTPEGEDEIVAAQCLNGRIQPADVAALALFLASDDARLCTGHEYFIDAGWR
ncbi:MAG TPA: SDR family oxidoreductase, partial [Croceibacterium sp.]